MEKDNEIFENMTDNSFLTEEPVAKCCKTLKEIIERSKEKKILKTSRRWENEINTLRTGEADLRF